MNNEIVNENLLRFDENVVNFEHIEDLFEMCEMFLQNAKMNDNVVYIRFSESSIKSKKSIDLTLHIDRRIFVIHNSYIEAFLFAMRDYS